MKAPIAKKISFEIEQHDNKRTDDYHWLRDSNWQQFIQGDLEFESPEIRQHIEAENSYKDFVMADYKEIEKTLYDEVLSRIKEDDQSFPVQKGDFFYYSREEKGKNYRILCRKHLNLDAEEEIYFDINKEAEGEELYMFGSSSTNRAQTHFVYSFNLTGSLEQTIKVRDLTTGKDLDWEFPNSTGSYIWDGDEHLYIVERDEHSRGRDIFKVNIHKGYGERELIFSKPKEYDSMYMWLSKTSDRKYYLLHLDSGSTHVVFVAEKGTDQFQAFARGDDDVSFTLDHYQGEFYILTNLDGVNNFKVMKCPAEKGKWAQVHWQEFIAENADLCLNDIHFYNQYMVLERRNNQNALDEVSVMNMSSKSLDTIRMPDDAYKLDFTGAWDHQSTQVLLNYESPVSPKKVLELDLVNMSVTERHTKIIPNFDASRYTLSRQFATARDGEKIPLTIIHKKDLKQDGSNKALVYGYGSYGYGIPAWFSSKLFSLIDRGFIYVIAHIRGGDEKGYSWYLDGKMHRKMNTFHDFIDACDYLIDQNYTTNKQIAINGGSAGGLLMGAVTNMRPDLFGCVIADVAFVDVISTISDDSLPLTPPEWEEWGNPIHSKEDFNYIMGYSPYDNVKSMDYPPMLFNSGISDEQVTYWEPTKMVAKLRELKTDDNPILLNMNMHAGHAGASKRYEWIEEVAFDYAFIMRCFGLK